MRNENTECMTTEHRNKFRETNTETNTPTARVSLLREEGVKSFSSLTQTLQTSPGVYFDIIQHLSFLLFSLFFAVTLDAEMKREDLLTSNDGFESSIVSVTLFCSKLLRETTTLKLFHFRECFSSHAMSDVNNERHASSFSLVNLEKIMLSSHASHVPSKLDSRYNSSIPSSRRKTRANSL